MGWSGHTGFIAIAGLLAGACGLSLTGTGDVAASGAPEGGTAPATDAAQTSDDGPSPADDSGYAIDAPSSDAVIVVKDASTKDVAAKDAPEEAGAMDGAPKDASPADVVEAAPPPPTVVQNVSNDDSDTQDLSTDVSPIGAGHLVVVLAAYDDNGQKVTSVTDGVNTYVTAPNLRSYASQQASEIWYAGNSMAGATSVSVSTSDDVHLSVWVLEVAGLAQHGHLDQSALTNNGPTTTTVAVPAVAPTSVPAFVVAAVGSNQSVESVASPFTLLAVLHGNSGAFTIATTVGSYSPIFTTQNAGWNASIADFL